MTRLRLPTTTTIWAVQHITNHGPVTDYHHTQQAAKNQYAHLTSSRTAAVMYQSTVVVEHTQEAGEAA